LREFQDISLKESVTMNRRNKLINEGLISMNIRTWLSSLYLLSKRLTLINTSIMSYIKCTFKEQDKVFEINFFDNDERIQEQKVQAMLEIHKEIIRIEKCFNEHELTVQIQKNTKLDLIATRTVEFLDTTNDYVDFQNKLYIKLFQESQKEAYLNIPAHFCTKVFGDINTKQVRFFTYADFNRIYAAANFNTLFQQKANCALISLSESDFLFVNKETLKVFRALFINPWTQSDYFNFLLADTEFFLDPSFPDNSTSMYIRASAVNQFFYPNNSKTYQL
jgi:hypothetical protein